jgi:hypothetical protein
MLGTALIAWILSAAPAEAQISLPPLPLPPISLPPVTLPPISLPPVASPSVVKVGCPWFTGIDAQTHNTGFPDTNALYMVAIIPTDPGNGATIKVTGMFPKVRYMSYQVYDGFRPGNPTDSLPDSRLVPDEGGVLDPNPAVLPDTGGYVDHYSMTVEYKNPPAAGQPRETNVLYAGMGTPAFALDKLLVLRLYLPNPGSDPYGDVPLPDLVFSGPSGNTDFNNTPDMTACNNLKFEFKVFLNTFPVIGLPAADPQFKPVSNNLNFIPNGEAGYLRAATGENRADMALVRQKAASAPALPPLLTADPQVRYLSICLNQLNNSQVVACLADRDMVLQDDGDYVVVISATAKRPPMANATFGYNWLPWGASNDGLIGLRQVLAAPGFAGDYNLAAAHSFQPVSTTLGEWAPDFSYCDSATFAANAPAGGAALMAACKAAQQTQFSLGGIRLPLQQQAPRRPALKR